MLAYIWVTWDRKCENNNGNFTKFAFRQTIISATNYIIIPMKFLNPAFKHVSKTAITLGLFSLTFSIQSNAQSVAFEEDLLDRGYVDRPWQRYEAEPDFCITNGTFLLPPDPYSQTPLQSEASRLTALQLKSKGDYVSWTVDRPGRGLTLRFSIPDSADGKGMKGNLKLKCSDGREPIELPLDSYWAWQYTVIAHANEKYPDNTPSPDKFARMRFDEATFLLDSDLPAGSTVTLEKSTDDGIIYTIDFLEIEPVAAALTFADINAADKVEYDGSGLSNFISRNGGKTIFIPAGYYNESRPITIVSDDTKIVGAGMWHTTINFTASSDDRHTYSARGIHSNCSRLELRGVSLNTLNNKRYYDNNSSFQVGKGLNGSWGSDSRISDVRIDHFECGAWITGARNLKVEHSRFRNNYADGINLANNSSDCEVSHCSFRNNGDDDMASWSTGSYATRNVYAYNTAENNWRASSLGFFGGSGHKAHHIAVYDAMEAGVRVTCDFPGTGFSTEGEISLSDITIHRCGALRGTPGEQGGFWGGADAALEFRAGYAYDLNNVRAENIDIYDSRGDAVSIEAQSGKRINNLELHDIHIFRVGGYGWGVNISPSVKGNGHYSRLTAEGVADPFMSTIPAGFDFTGDDSGIVDISEESDADAIDPQNAVAIFDMQGRDCTSGYSGARLQPGCYILCDSKGRVSKLFLSRNID